jgi:excinuclease ABC subunit A
VAKQKKITTQKNNENKKIIIKNASHNNLKNVSVNIPRNQLTLITGVSGSGKSTLAFDTLYAEGQRRFVESLSSYARQFLERMSKPEVESITGLPPAVAIEQKAPPRNPRSTVGTTTEIYDYIRALFARIGITYCVKCGKTVAADNPTSIAKKILEWNKDDKIYILFALKSNIINVASELERLGKLGFTRVVGKNSNDVIDYSELKLSIKDRYDDYLVLVDRIVLSDEKDAVSRLIDSLEVANNASGGKITIRNLTESIDIKFSSVYECADCDIKYELPEPKLFAFNSPKGACPTCQGLGIYFGIDENLVIPDESLSIEDQCVHPYRTPATISVQRELIKTAQKYNIPTDVPYSELTQIQKDFIWDGKDNYFGINGYFKFLETKTYKIQNRYVLAKYQGMTTCMKCGGSRLKQSARQVYIYGKNIPELVNMQMSELYDYIANLPLSKYEFSASEQILFELKARIKMLLDIGLDYLTLSRSCQTLSGGEYQRINLSTALGSSLVGTLYVLDEPSIGMHPKDTDRLLQILFRLKNLGNTIVVVEHDPAIIANADFIIDMGVGAGNSGGNIVSSGSFDDLLKSEESLTAMYFNNHKRIDIPQNRRTPSENKITISGARENNLKIDKLSIPLGCLTVVTGVSGSGKSSLVHNILYSGVMHAWGRTLKDKSIGKFDLIDGVDFVDGIELVDQTPIGKSSRSTPATYMKVFDYIRDLYCQTQAAKQLGLKSGYFSFNIPGGRCEVCEGDGYVNIDMQFLPDIKVVCESCGGDRYKKEVKEILYNEKTIIDVLEMSVDEALEHFVGITRIENKLKIMQDVGLGYLKLGQPSSALSGGEAQRIKLASHIDSSGSNNFLYIFDEPTTGLHLDDISKLINAINQLVDAGNSVLIIEHNLHIMSMADWIIDLGPDAGNRGGEVVGEGTPEQIATKTTHTGLALKEFLDANSGYLLTSTEQ